MNHGETAQTADSGSVLDPVAAARGHLALIRSHADETEHGRRLAPAVVEALRLSGLFAMGLPIALGGLETPIGTVLRAIEEVAYADGATCVWRIPNSSSSRRLK